MLPLLLLALILRAIRLDFQPLWWDEGYSVWFASHPLGQMAALTAQDIHPPLYYALLHGWTLIFGAGPVALRLFSVVTGVLAVPAIYLAGRRLYGRRAAGIAALLLAFNPFHIYYSQEVRMYGLVALFSALILAAAWQSIGSLSGQRGRAPALLPYVLLTTAALYTEYYAVFLPVGLTIYALWRLRGGPRALFAWLGAQAACALLYLPWVLYATPKLIPYVSQKIVLDADRPLAVLPYVGRHLSAFLAGHLEGPLAPWWPAVLALLGILLVFGMEIRNRRYHPHRRSEIGDSRIHNLQASAMLATVVATALLLGYAISTRYPFFPSRGERLLLLALPPFVLLFAAAVDALWQLSRGLGIATVGLAGAVAGASLLGFYTVPRYPGDDYRPLLAQVVQQGRPEDTLFCVYPWQAGYWRSYGDPSGPQALLTPSPEWGEGVSQALDAALARGHVWFPAHLALGGQLETAVERYLAGRSRTFAVEWYGPGTRLSAWSRDAETPLEPVSLSPVRFILPGAAQTDGASGANAGKLSSGEILLNGVSAAAGPVPAANAVAPLTLSWEAASAPPDLAVSVRLVDALGQIWTQHDYVPLGSPTPAGTENSSAGGAAGGAWAAEDRIGLLIPAGTPPGAYSVKLALRLKDGDRPLEAVTADGKRSTAAALFGLSVTPAGEALGPERLPIAQPQPAVLGDGLRFLGYSAPTGPLPPGESRKISLFWQAAAQPSADYQAFVQLIDGRGVLESNWEAAPGAAYPTSQWAPGTLMRTQADVRPRADLPDGAYTLIAGLFRPGDGVRLRTVSGSDHLVLGRVTVRGRSHETTPPRPMHPLDASFGTFARLVGYDLSAPGGITPAVPPGGQVSLVLYWQAAGTAAQPYTVFVHLVGDQGRQWGAGDGEPGGGAYTTTGWVRGEYLADRHQIAVDPDAPPGVYHVAIGLYDPASGERLAGPLGAPQILLDTPIEVK